MIFYFMSGIIEYCFGYLSESVPSSDLTEYFGVIRFLRASKKVNGELEEEDDTNFFC